MSFIKRCVDCQEIFDTNYKGDDLCESCIDKMLREAARKLSNE